MHKNLINIRAVNDLLLFADLQLSETVIIRLRWLKWCGDHDGNVEDTCHRFGISRSTFLRWAERFDPLDPNSLEDQSKRPKKLRAPETSERVIGIIHFLRELYPTMSKQVIVRELERYGETVSSATVGRVISRYGFFFGQGPSHQRKRQEYQARIQRESSQGTPPDSLPGGLGFVPSALLVLLAAFSAFGAFMQLSVPKAFAAESTTFTSNADPGNSADGSSVTGSSYQVDSVTMTWRESTGESDSFSEGTPDDEDDSDDSGSSGGSDGGSTGSTGDGGSHRGHGTNVTGSPSVAESSQDGEQTESAPDQPSHSAPVQPKPVDPSLQAPESVDDDGVVAKIILQTPSAPIFGAPRFALRPVFKSRFAPAEDFFAAVDPEVPNIHRAPAEIDAPQNAFAFIGQRLALIVQTFSFFLLLLLLSAIRGKHHLKTDSSFLRFFWIPLPILFDREDKRRAPRRKKKPATRKKQQRNGKSHRWIAALLIFALTSVPYIRVEAVATVPQNIIYNGQLKNASGTAITTNHMMRFSFWNSSDAVPADLNANGTINTSGATYAGWQEFHNVKPNTSGYFTVKLGSGTSLPAFTAMSQYDLLNLHMQVEVKPVGSLDTAYEILDTNTANPNVDRSPIRSVPFALNADLLDQRDVGTGSGNIAILGPNGVFDPARIPGGTNSGSFVIDRDGSSTTTALQFGSSVTKQLTYDGTNGRFNFSDDVRIDGNLTVTGLINGVDVTALSPAQNTQLRVSSGAGLTVNVAGGGYRLNGSTTSYNGITGVSVQNNATNYVFFGSGGLAVSTIGFPSDESAIRVAQVVTSGGAITSVSDKRVLQTDDRERTIEEFFNAGFEGAVYQGDGITNIGQLSMSHDAANLRNFYLWTSSKTTLQDYDVILRVPLSSDFTGWVDNPLRVAYRSTSANATDNRLDFTVFDTSGNAVTLSGSTTSLKSTTWATTQVEFASGATWTAGQEFVIKFKLSAKDAYQMHLGGFKLQYKEFLND